LCAIFLPFLQLIVKNVFLFCVHEHEVEINTCLQAHNAKRSLHGAAPLVWDATLARHAKEWAEVLVRWGEMEHARDTGEGENLYWYKGSKVATCVEAVKSW